jgi:hypothetical protein
MAKWIIEFFWKWTTDIINPYTDECERSYEEGGHGYVCAGQILDIEAECYDYKIVENPAEATAFDSKKGAEEFIRRSTDGECVSGNYETEWDSFAEETLVTGYYEHYQRFEVVPAPEN